jgi:hypothetical protein
MDSTQAATVAVLAPGLVPMVIVAPFMVASAFVAVDAAAFASSLGVPQFATTEQATVHEADPALPLVARSARRREVFFKPPRSRSERLSIAISAMRSAQFPTCSNGSKKLEAAPRGAGSLRAV